MIALIVTIIVLVILAGISINVLVGNHSIIDTAQESEEMTRKEGIKENIKLAWSGCDLEYKRNAIEGNTIENNIVKKDFFTKENLNKSLSEGEVIDVKYSEDEAIPSEVTYRIMVGNKYREYKVKITSRGEVIIEDEKTDIGNNPSSPEQTYLPTLPPVGITPPEEGWTVEEAKGLVKRDGLKAHIGEKVAYNPVGGGIWRIFYYDNEDQGNGKGYFGDDVGTVYLKRDYKSAMTTLRNYMDYEPADGGELMKRMNPKWSNSPYSIIDLPNEHCVAWLCDASMWEQYKIDGVANYAIGGASVEMFMKAYNVYKEDDNALDNMIGGEYGYAVRSKGMIGSSIEWYNNTEDYFIDPGPGGIFGPYRLTPDWLASPCYDGNDRVYYVRGATRDIHNGPFTYEGCLLPVVSLKM